VLFQAREAGGSIKPRVEPKAKPWVGFGAPSSPWNGRQTPRLSPTSWAPERFT